MKPPVNLFEDLPKTELAEVIELWQDAFEWSYYDSVLAGILLAAPIPSKERIVETTDNEISSNGSKPSEWGVEQPLFKPFFVLMKENVLSAATLRQQIKIVKLLVPRAFLG